MDPSWNRIQHALEDTCPVNLEVLNAGRGEVEDVLTYPGVRIDQTTSPHLEKLTL